MVSGGSTPLLCFEALSSTPISWSNIDVFLTDERDVPTDHPASNERMLREKLMVNFANKCAFVPLSTRDTQPHNRLACVLVGMGEDGHFASLFPDSPQLAEGLSSSACAIHVSTPSSEYPRISATLSTLTNSDLIVLLIFGEKKRRIVESPDGYPVAELLRQTRTNVEIIWAP